MNKDLSKRITAFTDLEVWQQGHKLVLLIYKLTNNFPKSETFALVDQLRRAVSSITANIAEGFGRQTFKEKLQFYYHSKGSLNEVKNFVLIAKDLGYLTQEDFNMAVEQLNRTDQLLQGFIRKTRTFVIR